MIGPTPFFHSYFFSTEFCFLGILTKPKACITYSSAILTLMGTFLSFSYVSTFHIIILCFSFRCSASYRSWYISIFYSFQTAHPRCSSNAVFFMYVFCRVRFLSCAFFVMCLFFHVPTFFIRCSERCRNLYSRRWTASTCACLPTGRQGVARPSP